MPALPTERSISFQDVVEGTDPACFMVQTKAEGPVGSLPLTD